MDIYTPNGMGVYSSLEGRFDNLVKLPSAEFLIQVADLVNSIDHAATDLRCKIRVSKEQHVYVRFPVDHERLRLFLAACAPLTARKIRVDWSLWFKDC